MIGALKVSNNLPPFIAPPPERNGSIKGGMKKLNE
jgi:hypothetical protein